MKIIINDKEYDSDNFNDTGKSLLKKLQDNLAVKAPLEYQLQCVSLVHDSLLKQLTDEVGEEVEGE
jgi:hypothetical protein